QRQRDLLAFPGGAPMAFGGEQVEGAQRAGGDVPAGHDVVDRPFVRLGAGVVRIARDRVDGVVEPGGAVGPALDPYGDQVGAAGGQLVVGEEAAAREVGDEHAAAFAGRGDQGGDQFAPLGLAEVDRDGLLAFLGPFPVEAGAAAGYPGPAIEIGAAADGVEANDFGPHLGEVQGAGGGGDEGGAFDDAHALEN